MKTKPLFLFLIILLALAGEGFAESWNTTGTITKVGLREDQGTEGRIRVFTAGDWAVKKTSDGNAYSCGNDNIVIFDKQHNPKLGLEIIYSTLLTAGATGNTVVLYGSGCIDGSFHAQSLAIEF